MQCLWRAPPRGGTDGALLATAIAEQANVEESTLLTQMVDVPKGCEEVVMVAEEVTVEATERGRRYGLVIFALVFP